jgi:hypothetical protein
LGSPPTRSEPKMPPRSRRGDHRPTSNHRSTETGLDGGVLAAAITWQEAGAATMPSSRPGATRGLLWRASPGRRGRSSRPQQGRHHRRRRRSRLDRRRHAVLAAELRSATLPSHRHPHVVAAAAAAITAKASPDGSSGGGGRTRVRRGSRPAADVAPRVA